MNKSEPEKFLNVELEREIIKNRKDILEFCDVCFIAFGSHEKRIYIGNNVSHLDCAKKIKSKKESVAP